MLLAPRRSFARYLGGDVLEVGPGTAPFPTSAGARVRYADRSVAGGRDANWPELIGQPSGPDAEYESDLDTQGLRMIGNGRFDAVIASHVLEHLANPLQALVEFSRVLRSGGKLAIVMPDRSHTFDSTRRPTPFAHLLNEHRDGITQTSVEHIREFCAAIYALPPIHPPEVRAWHDPDALNDDLIELHRRRSIHVHCWSPEEFAVMIGATVAHGLCRWRVVDMYLPDDFADPLLAIESGILLERDDSSRTALELTTDFFGRWAALLLTNADRSPARIQSLLVAVARDLAGREEERLAACALNSALLGALGQTLRYRLSAVKRQASNAAYSGARRLLRAS